VIRVQLGDIRVDPAALRRYTRSAGGPVVADITRRATNVQTDARRRVQKRTRATERSIVKRVVVEGRGVVGYVVTDSPIAGYLHDGTAPHVIRPRVKKVLRFPAGGTIVFAMHVNHPGTEGSQFLVRALQAGRH
jgi:hypothetical protein